MIPDDEHNFAMVIDLRDYTTTSGARDRFIARCESELFIEQERLGATFVGTFCDADDPDRFVWLRAMPDMATRQRVLTEFYSDGAMWRAQRAEVNSWIADSDNVLLVEPASSFSPSARDQSIVGMFVYLESAPLSAATATKLARTLERAVIGAGGRMLVTLVTLDVDNNYPRHPIRRGEHGLIWFATFAARTPIPSELRPRWLLPTQRSLLR